MSEAGPGPVRLRPRAYLVLGLASLLVVGAVATRSPVPLLAAVPLLLTPAIALLGRPPEVGAVDLSWEASTRGPELTVTGRLTGAFGSAAGSIEVVPPTVAGAQPVGNPRFVRSPGEVRFVLAWRLEDPGVLKIDPPTVVWRDPLDLVETPLPGSRPELTVERALPELQRVVFYRLDRTLHLPGETRSQRVGTSGEFFGVRDAAPNEPPRRINWRASARSGRLLANDFLLDRTGDVILLLDVRPYGLGPTADERLVSVARAGASALVDAFLRGKVRVGFAAFGEFLSAVPLGSGRPHRARLQAAVLASRRSAVAAPPERCAISLRRYFRPGVTTVLLSSWEGDRAFDLLPYLRRGGFPAVMVSPSPLTLTHRSDDPVASEEATVARRLDLLTRRARLAALWEHGTVFDWADYWSLAGLAQLLRRPTRRRVT